MTQPLPEGSVVPEDVVTGCWLWVIALPLMVIGYVVAATTMPGPMPAWLVNASTAIFAINTAAVVVALLVLVRKGYRWARTVLTGAGAASVVYAGTTVFEYAGPALPAFVVAATSIIGSVLIGGGAYLLHRKASHEFFTR